MSSSSDVGAACCKSLLTRRTGCRRWRRWKNVPRVPAQWEGTLEDGRTVYAHYRGGALSVGVGDDIDAAVSNGGSGHALYADHVGDCLDGFMDVEELKTHLHGLLEFPPDLVVENTREPDWDLEALEKLLAPREPDNSQPTWPAPD
jgi:hypothetical protein